ncbi:hypothetical protein KUTeg_006988 [Tegillarca granosa]|uniref:RWD domain-containing protein 1 n=1 Tax=Tegillarca granosa TaxID=220873 RepID=A0ABQ9FBY6_TEGGR|nr:hypothetical protein KUTeg_006988 [Tegillarca granosa]
MVMVFTIVSAVQEQLTVLIEETREKQIAEKERAKREEEERERKKFEGTRVTIESFLAWKKKFDAEMMEKKRLKNELIKQEKGKTGK